MNKNPSTKKILNESSTNKKIIVDVLRALAKGASKIRLKVYLPTIIIEEFQRVFRRRTSCESWSVISVAKVLRFLADMIE